nr:GNAT family N-acetyltransferase [Methylobacterium sp. ZNC0032]
MSLSVKFETRIDHLKYQEFLHSCPERLIYNTLEYIETLRLILKSEGPVFVVALRHGQIVGSMAFFVKETAIGSVANSLPYFGSHGDVLVRSDEASPDKVTAAILDAYIAFCHRERIGSVNIVGHLLGSHLSAVVPARGLSIWDQRIGQISTLPATTSVPEAMPAILAQCHQKTRNLVRKGLRAGFEIEISDKPGDWQLMQHHHKLGMDRIGGRSKSVEEFAALRSVLHPAGMCSLYVARHNGQFAGALLNLQYGDWIEYFTPVAVQEFRTDQVMSALIATAMSDACLEGRRFWNWGGTWTTQSGVHHFKQGWGAVDHPYYYFGKVFDNRLMTAEKAALIDQFPFFYVRPFS